MAASPGGAAPDPGLDGGSGEKRELDGDSQRDFSEQAIKYQFTGHLGSTRFTAGMWWTPGMLDIDEAGLETWWGDSFLRTAEYPENCTPYGGLLRSTAPPVPVPPHLVFADPLHFTGKPTDLESGFAFFGARHYASQFCRWLSADQPFTDNWIQTPQTWNLCSYVGNDPINNIDLNGSSTKDIALTGTTLLAVPSPATQLVGAVVLGAALGYMAFDLVKDKPAHQISGSGSTFGMCGDGGYTAFAMDHSVGESANQGGENTQAGQTGDPSADPAGPDPHGNNKQSQKPQHRYEIEETATGDVVKTGISGQPLNQNGTSPRANPQVNALNKQDGQGTYSARVVETNIPGRKAALVSEQGATNQLKAQGNTLGWMFRTYSDVEPGITC